MEDETCWFPAADFDKASWRDDAAAVERASGNIPPSMPAQEAAVASEETMSDAQMAKEEARDEKARAAATGAPTPEAVWSDLASAGVAFLEKLSEAISRPKRRYDSDGEPISNRPDSLTSRDERTGQPCLKLPLPKPEVLKSLADLLGNLAGLVK